MKLALLEWSVRSLFMAAGIGATLLLLRIRSASLRHSAWTALLVAMLLLPAWTQWGPSVAAPILPVAEQTQLPSFALLPLATSAESIPLVREIAIPPSRSRPIPRPIDWARILVALYLAGFSIMFARLIAGTLQIRAMLRGSREVEGIRITSQCGAPVTAGWLRPVLLLPEDWPMWSASKLDAVLIHEREHIRRRDPLVQWLALLNRCIFWFHPVAWWLEHKLAALSEEACDAAVLSRGHTAQDYSGYLIEIARSITTRGARLRWAGSTAFSAGKLPYRIRRMMETRHIAATSRLVRVSAAMSCTLLLAACLACSVGNSSRTSSHFSRPAAGQPTMNELYERQREAGQEMQEMNAKHLEMLAVRAYELTEAEAKTLEAEVRSHPENLDNIWVLVRYYGRRKDTKPLDALTFWYIAQNPELRTHWSARPVWDRVWNEATYAHGRDIWVQQLKKSWDNPYFYMNAADYLSGHDNELAEQALLEGQRRFPARGAYSGLHWEVLLAHHYVWALVGHTGQVDTAPLWQGTPFQTPTQYAQKVRAALLASNDDELVARVAERLPSNWQDQRLALDLSNRAVSLNPASAFHHMQNEWLKRQARLREVQHDPSKQTDGDRLALLLSSLPFFSSLNGSVEADAWRMLALAAANPGDPNAGTAVFLGNMVIGNAALDRGDRYEALRHLEAASEAPPNEYLRYNQVDMLFPSKLVDWGEREAVAKFLERCAGFNAYGGEYRQWAVMIRRGINPTMNPRSGFRSRPT